MTNRKSEAALPKGLVYNTERISSELRKFAGVDIQDIAKLWRTPDSRLASSVYSTIKATLHEDTGRRLENLLWRIWGNRCINRTIQGVTLADLFVYISEGTGVVNVGHGAMREADYPLQEPPRRYTTFNPQSPSPPPSASLKSAIKKMVAERKSANAPRTSLPPPILKKSRLGENGQSKTDRLLASGIMGGNSLDNLCKSPTPIPGPQRTTTTHADKSHRKKTTFATDLTPPNGEQLRERHLLLKTPPGAALGRGSRITTTSLNAETQSGCQTTSIKVQKLVLPEDFSMLCSTSDEGSHSWRNRPSTRFEHTSNASSISSSPNPCLAPRSIQHFTQTRSHIQEPQLPQPSTDTLVDKGFRMRFAEKRLQESCVSSLTNLGPRMETTSVLAPGPQWAIGSLKERNEENSTAQKDQQFTHPGKLTPIHSPCIHGDGDGHYAQANTGIKGKPISLIPETRAEHFPHASRQPRSQLSRLIEQDRKMSAGKVKTRKHGDR